MDKTLISYLKELFEETNMFRPLLSVVIHRWNTIIVGKKKMSVKIES